MYLGRDAFGRGLGAIAALRDAGALRLLVLGTFVGRSPIQFELHETHDATSSVFQQHESDIDEMRRVIADVSDVLRAVVGQVAVERFVEVRTDPERWEDHETEDAETSRWKYEQVSTSFDIDTLRRRLWAKRAAKVDLPGRFDWEVSLTVGDATGAPPGGKPVPIGTLRVQTEPSQPALLSGITGTEAILAVDAEDAAYMIDSLQRLLEALEEAETLDLGEGRDG